MRWCHISLLCCVCVCGTRCMHHIGVIFSVFSFFLLCDDGKKSCHSYFITTLTTELMDVSPIRCDHHSPQKLASVTVNLKLKSQWVLFIFVHPSALDVAGLTPSHDFHYCIITVAQRLIFFSTQSEHSPTRPQPQPGRQTVFQQSEPQQNRRVNAPLPTPVPERPSGCIHT